MNAQSTANPQTGMSIVNLAARQRMLSQRLTLQIILASEGRDGQLAAARSTLDTFETSQQQLVQSARQLQGTDGNRLRAVYFEPGQVARTVDTFIRDARAALDMAAQTQRNGGAVDRLVAAMDPVLQALNQATSAFDELGAAKEQAIMRELKGIVSDIQSVAREAKIVSFNAQVIAARAGPVGREFSVVANTLANISSEVDTLARKGMALATR
jgi:methyl-accepting chemotaxis protein